MYFKHNMYSLFVAKHSLHVEDYQHKNLGCEIKLDN